ncbi:sensor histidine kinase [Rhizobium sp. PL01]|uniref:sensor histidine kinase n=1 Tax=Rhizobium sp. PL01 TaxID=3085631 RepID=UPI0029813197|nr:ATP-binding protein [Rhizobium sp. PL01]MDW5317581.1 ATP-binding protein [Rhizobium sp. PL01]
MIQLRLFQTTAFRLAILVSAFFALLTAVLFAIVFFLLADYANSQIRSVIDAETARLVQIVQSAGLPAAVAFVRSRPASEDRDPIYAILDESGRLLAGRLAFPPSGPDWQSIREPRDDGEVLLAKRTAMPGKGAIVVAYPSGEEDELKGAILVSFAWAAAITVVLSIFGGLILSRSFLRRVETFTTATSRFAEGYLSERIPLRGSNDEFDRLAGNINEMLTQIQALMESMRQVSNDIAHDLRTPLARLRQGLDLALRKSADVRGFQVAIDRAILETDDILATFAALLRIAQIEAGTRRAAFARINLSDLCETVTDVFSAVAEDGGRRIIAKIAPDIWIDGDRELLTQLLANVVENALRHTPTQTLVQIGLGTNASGCPIINVSDNGSGIPVEARAAVFRRFYRMENSRSTSGHGLGLALAAAVAQLHNIDIRLGDNQPGLKIEMTFQGERE